MGSYRKPGSVEEAVALLRRGPLTRVAGCTDHYCRPDRRPLDEDVLDLSGLNDARGVSAAPGAVRIGALTTWSDLIAAPLPARFDALKAAATQVGGVQIQNAGTLGGNLCNASPAADGVPCLLALDASVELSGVGGTRTLPLDRFILGPRRTALADDELLTAIVVPLPSASGRSASAFVKLGARAYQVISIVMVAVVVDVDAAGRISAAAVAVGSCSPVACRLPGLERALLGRATEAQPLSTAVDERHLAPLAPVSDGRGTAAYRLDAARTLVCRALDEAQGRLR